MNGHLETVANTTDLSEYESLEEVASLVIILLDIGHDWVRVYAENTGQATQWNVMERDKSGQVTQVVSTEFDGETQIIKVK